jgi:GDP-L-fucose synthase
MTISTFKDQNILVTGGTGMIGRALVKKLLTEGARISIVSIDKPKKNDKLLEQTEFIFADLRNFSDCKRVTKNKDIVFHLAGIKGSPKLTNSQPATFFTNTMMFNLNMMEAARLSEVKRYLFTSSVGVYAPSKIFNEEDVWKTFPSENDKFAGYAKRMGELQAESYDIEYKWKGVSIVRPANVYGPFDNFDPNTGMVIPSLISRFASQENPIKIWGDGSAIRDFIYSDDVATGMMEVVKSNFTSPVNLGSGVGVKISKIVEILNSLFPGKEIVWDTSMPKGDDIRVMNTERAKSLGINPRTDIVNGIKKAADWYKNNLTDSDERYNAFNEKK